MRAFASLLVLACASGAAHAQGSCGNFGSACGVPSISCTGAPTIGTTFEIVLPGTPGAPMLLVVGPPTNPTPLVPFPYACIPPGCPLLAFPLVSILRPVGPQAQAVFDLPVPDNPALVGAILAAQGWTASPGAPCAYASPGLRITLG